MKKTGLKPGGPLSRSSSKGPKRKGTRKPSMAAVNGRMPATDTEMAGHRATGPRPATKGLASMQDKPNAPAGRDRKCRQCGGEFRDRQANRIVQKFCSPRCAGDAARERHAKTYPPREELEALYVTQRLSLADVGRRYGRTYTWAAGALKARGIPTRSLKESVRRKPLHQKRDRGRWNIDLKREERCRNCGDAEAVLHLHHVIPRSKCRATKYDLLNGLPLCTSCHLGWHHRRVTIYRDVFTPEEWAYLSSVQLTGEEIGPWLDKRYPVRPADGEEPVPTCQRGHPFIGDNILVKSGGNRVCRACANLRAAKYRAQRKEAA